MCSGGVASMELNPFLLKRSSHHSFAILPCPHLPSQTFVCPIASPEPPHQHPFICRSYQCNFLCKSVSHSCVHTSQCLFSLFINIKCVCGFGNIVPGTSCLECHSEFEMEYTSDLHLWIVIKPAVLKWKQKTNNEIVGKPNHSMESYRNQQKLSQEIHTKSGSRLELL